MKNEEEKELLNEDVNDADHKEQELLDEIEETVTASAIGCVACCG